MLDFDKELRRKNEMYLSRLDFVLASHYMCGMLELTSLVMIDMARHAYHDINGHC